MSDSTSDPKLAALEKSLAALVPVPGRIDRDQLLYRAGQESVRRPPWVWPSATAMLALVAAGLGTALAIRPAPPTMERIVYVHDAESHTPASDSTPSDARTPPTLTQNGGLEATGALWANSAGYFQQRDQVIRWGVDALPPSPSSGSTSPELSIENMLGMPKKKSDQSGLFRFKF
jgi:hypothetical protein